MTNRTILITRPREQAEGMIREIEQRGGRAVVAPMIAVADPPSWDACDVALASLASYDALVFASANAVRSFLARCAALGVDRDRIAGPAVYVVGRKTAEAARALGLPVDVQPGEFSAQGLLKALETVDLGGKRLLLPRGTLGRDDLAEGLRRRGARVDTVTVYATVAAGAEGAAEVNDLIAAGLIDVVTFASPSAVDAFAGQLDEELRGKLHGLVLVAVIGPTTAQAVRTAGWAIDIMAEEATAGGLVAAIEHYFEQSTGR